MSLSTTNTPRTRRRGAQPGNSNALRHGFYSRQFRKGEAADLDALTATDLNSEIAMLRVSARRMFELASDNNTPDNDTDPLEYIPVLAALGSAAKNIATLMRTNLLLNSGQTGVEATITEALLAVMKDFHNETESESETTG